jgi:hypothetical protein
VAQLELSANNPLQLLWATTAIIARCKRNTRSKHNGITYCQHSAAPATTPSCAVTTVACGTDLSHLCWAVKSVPRFQHWNLAIWCHPCSQNVNHASHLARRGAVCNAHPRDALVHVLLNLQGSCAFSVQSRSLSQARPDGMLGCQLLVTGPQTECRRLSRRGVLRKPNISACMVRLAMVAQHANTMLCRCHSTWIYQQPAVGCGTCRFGHRLALILTLQRLAR